MAMTWRSLIATCCWVARARYPGAHRGSRGMDEEQRVAFYHANEYAWPPKEATSSWPPVGRHESASYAKSRDEIEAWIRRDVKTYKAKFDEWATLVQSRLMPSFTKRGFETVDISKNPLYPQLAAEYAKHVTQPGALERLPLEHSNEESMRRGGESQVAYEKRMKEGPKYYRQPRLNGLLLEELRPFMESWAGVELRNGQAYGVRVYRNGSALVNHVDRSETHVISAIVHIDHDLEEDWPLEIEDHDGVWHAVNMKPGEMVMYESSKLYHARLRPMRGRAYASVFLHWYPKENWNWTMWDIHVAVPPNFQDPPKRRQREKPPFLRSYNAYWASRGLEPPVLPRGIENPVQSYNLEQPRHVLAPDQAEREAIAEKLRDAAASGDFAAVARALPDDASAADVINRADENGWAAIHEAVRSGNSMVVQMLVERGADLDHCTNLGDDDEEPEYGGNARWWSRNLHGTEHRVSQYLSQVADAPEHANYDL